ncbi:MAG: hypothetical protein CVU39_24375 [Chloroflexi bacterium HGW-Chloroflexi-10]|nr:MAG: hypothetical protein CVU39_24375 [Chloroflexi bacterium HGW-Chloroflexi-10]
MTQNNDKQPSGIGNFFRGLLRLIIAILIGLIIGAALYAAGAYLFSEAIIPTQQNTVALSHIDQRVNEQWVLLQQRNDSLEKRLSNLEVQYTQDLDRITELSAVQEEITRKLETLITDIGNLNRKLENAEKALAALEKNQTSLSEEQLGLQKNLDELEIDALIQPIYLDVQTIKTMQQINRSRLYLLQDNYGSAKTELELASTMLANLITKASFKEQDLLLLWRARLDLAISNLPAHPELANDDLEILWSMMSNGLLTQPTPSPETIIETPQDEAQPTGTPTPAGTPEPTPIPTATP